MDYKDYYKILGVEKKASEKEIKSAYRKLARKYHPDVNPGDAAAETRFKEINEAHAVLSDPERRKKYDALGPDWQQRFRQTPGAGGGTYTYAPGGAGTADFSDFFEGLFGRTNAAGGTGGFDFDLGSIFGRGRGRSAQSPGIVAGGDVEQPVEVSLSEAMTGVERAFTIQSTQTCPACRGTGMNNDAPCQTCGGTGMSPRTKRLDVKIPAGVRDGSRVRVTGEGNPGQGGGPAGNLYLVVHVVPDARFARHGDNLHTEVDVPFTTLVLGGEIEVPTPRSKLTMRVPPASQNGRTLRLAGQGMPNLKTGVRGDLLVKLSAVLPTAIDERQRELFEQLAQAGA